MRVISCIHPVYQGCAPAPSLMKCITYIYNFFFLIGNIYIYIYKIKPFYLHFMGFYLLSIAYSLIGKFSVLLV
jgi:hypothetical protein